MHYPVFRTFSLHPHLSTTLLYFGQKQASKSDFSCNRAKCVCHFPLTSMEYCDVLPNVSLLLPTHPKLSVPVSGLGVYTRDPPSCHLRQTIVSESLPEFYPNSSRIITLANLVRSTVPPCSPPPPPPLHTTILYACAVFIRNTNWTLCEVPQDQM